MRLATTRKIRLGLGTCISLWLGLSFVFPAATVALPITYTVKYDSATQETVFQNDISSEACLFTYATTGDYTLKPNWLAPGGSITYYSDGAFSPFAGGTATDYVNDLTKTLHVKYPTEDKWDEQWYREVESATWLKLVECVQLERSKCYQIKHKKGSGWAATDDIEGLDDAEGFVCVNLGDPNGTPWFFGPGQSFVEIMYGGVRISTDTDRFFSAVTPNSATGCIIPEPSTIVLLGCGLAGLAVFRRRRLLKKA